MDSSVQRPFWSRPYVIAGLLAALAGFIVFIFFGSSVTGYIPSSSLPYWWTYLWFVSEDNFFGATDTEHGPILLALALLIFVRNLMGLDSRKGQIFPNGYIPVFVAVGVTYATVFAVHGDRGRSLVNWLGTDDHIMRELPMLGLLLMVGAAVYCFLHNREKIRAQANRPAPLIGGAVLFGALCIHLFGYLGQEPRASIIAFLTFLVGLAFLAGGRHAGKAAIFPAILLVFTIPLGALNDEIGLKMRMWVIDATALSAKLIGIEVIQNGSNLVSPDGSYRYDVAPACSGIRSLMSLTALSLVIGYLSFNSLWRRLTLLVLALPFAFVGNYIRIFSIILAGQFFGQEAGTKVHDYMGFGIFIVVLALSLLTVGIIKKILPEQEDIDISVKNPRPMASNPALYWMGVSAPLALALLIAVGGGILANNIRSSPVGLYMADSDEPAELPKFLGWDWRGIPAQVSAVELEMLPPDTGFSRKWYVDFDNNAVFISIVLSGKDRSSIHRPEKCLVASGWTIAQSFKTEFEVPNLEGNLPVTILEIERTFEKEDGSHETHEERAFYAYWFVGGDKMVATHTDRILTGYKDLILKQERHRWAYIVGQTTYWSSRFSDEPPTEADREVGLERLREVVALAVPEFQKTGFPQEESEPLPSSDPVPVAAR